MASGASTVSVVKAGYWIFGKDSTRPVGDIPSELVTHLYAGFAKVNDDDGTVTAEPQFRAFPNKVRERNSKVKTLLSIGGEGVDLSVVVASSDKRKNLIKSSIDLAREFGFDGLDLCWMYPSKADLEKPLASLLIEWHDAIKPYNLLLTAAVFHHPGIPDINGNITFKYPIQAIKDNLDWINVLAVDFYTPKCDSSPGKTGPVHAWRNPREQNKCGSEGIYNWINGTPNPVKIDTQKLVLGLPFYGYKWTLKKEDQHDFFAETDPANPAGPLAFRNIQEQYINKNGGHLVNDHDMFVASYWYHKVTWIGFEDEHSIATKVKEAIRGNNLGGYVAWHLEADDYNWTLSKAASNAWDNAINNPGSTSTTTTTTTHTGTTTTTTITTTTTAVSPEGEISKTVTTNITTTDDAAAAAAAAASGEGDTTTDGQNTRSRTSTTTTTTTTTSATTTTTTATATSSSSLTICNIL